MIDAKQCVCYYMHCLSRDKTFTDCPYELMHLVASPTLKFSNHSHIQRDRTHRKMRKLQQGIQVMAKVEYHSLKR